MIVTSRCATVILSAVVVFFLLNPPLWDNPIRDFCTYVQLNTQREGFNISTWFLGRMYNLDHPLPWYNTLFWVSITVPVGLLPFLCLGIVDIFRRRRGGAILFGAAVFLLVRALPWAPPHDGIRLFLPAFPLLAMLVGIGAGRLWRAMRSYQIAWRLLIRGMIVTIWLGGLWNLYTFSPQWLSYYNAAIGGLPGAVRAGMEPTYWWDTLDRETLDWLNTHTPPDERVAFAPFSRKTLALYQQWGYLEPPLWTRPDERCRFYVMQYRPSAIFPFDRQLLENRQPVYVKRLFGVPLLGIYDLSPEPEKHDEH